MARDIRITDHKGNKFKTISEMCKFWNTSLSLYYRRKNLGWDIEHILENKNPNTVKYYDHKGNEFNNINDMCKYWHISTSTYYNLRAKNTPLKDILDPERKYKYIDKDGNKFITKQDLAKFYNISLKTLDTNLKKGLSLDDAIIASKIAKQPKWTDHNGNTFNSMQEMADFWGIKTPTLSKRLRDGLTIEKALEPVCREIKDHTGRTFKNKEEMCRHYDVTRSTLERRLKEGWSLKEALLKPSLTGKTFTDHTGRVFKNFGQMCKHWGLPDSTVQNRIYKLGYTIEQALTEPIKTQNTVGKTCVDHLGNIYESKATMCCKYGIPRNVFHRRLKDGWDLEKALTTPPSRKNGQGRTIYDHKGNAYVSVAEMCNAYNIDFAMYGSRIRQGWSLQKTLETPPTEVTIGKKECVDHEGNVFKSQAEMMRHWGVTKDQLRSRIELGWTLEQILTTPGRLPHKHPWTDHKGKTWDSMEEMLEHYNVAPAIFKRRLNVMGLSLEEALTGHSLHEVQCKDHLGNTFDTINDICQYYNLGTSMYHHRLKKLKWSIEKTLCTLSINRNFGKNLKVTNHVDDYYYKVVYNDNEYIWHAEKILNYYRKDNNIAIKESA